MPIQITIRGVTEKVRNKLAELGVTAPIHTGIIRCELEWIAILAERVAVRSPQPKGSGGNPGSVFQRPARS